MPLTAIIAVDWMHLYLQVFLHVYTNTDSWNMTITFGKYVFVVTPEVSHPRDISEATPQCYIVDMGLVGTGVV